MHDSRTAAGPSLSPFDSPQIDAFLTNLKSLADNNDVLVPLHSKLSSNLGIAHGQTSYSNPVGITKLEVRYEFAEHLAEILDGKSLSPDKFGPVVDEFLNQISETTYTRLGGAIASSHELREKFKESITSIEGSYLEAFSPFTESVAVETVTLPTSPLEVPRFNSMPHDQESAFEVLLSFTTDPEFTEFVGPSERDNYTLLRVARRAAGIQETAETKASFAELEALLD